MENPIHPKRTITMEQLSEVTGQSVELLRKTVSLQPVTKFKRDNWRQKTPKDQLTTIHGAIEGNALNLDDPRLINPSTVATRIIELARQLEDLSPFLTGEQQWDDGHPTDTQILDWIEKHPGIVVCTLGGNFAARFGWKVLGTASTFRECMAQAITGTGPDKLEGAT